MAHHSDRRKIGTNHGGLPGVVCRALVERRQRKLELVWKRIWDQPESRRPGHSEGRHAARLERERILGRFNK